MACNIPHPFQKLLLIPRGSARHLTQKGLRSAEGAEKSRKYGLNSYVPLELKLRLWDLAQQG